MKFPFVGGSYESRSPAVDAQRSVNLYPEGVESGSGKNAAVLYTRPGYTLFCTPNAGPGRGLWPGENRLFAASGSKLFEIFGNASSNNRGDIGNDTNPVTILPNGSQIGIISAGKFYCDSGAGPVQAEFNAQSGVVNTAGAIVTWTGGDQFLDAGPGGTLNVVTGEQMVIGATTYTVLTVDSATQVTLTSSAGTQTGAAYSVGFLVGAVNTAGTAVTWVSGDEFDTLHMAGASIRINGVVYTVQSVTDSKHLVLTSSAGTQTGHAYSSNPIVTASSGVFLGGYFMVAEAFNSKVWRISALEDGRLWDEADFALKEAYPDNIMAMLADHKEVYLFGTEQATEVWRNTGAANFPLEEDQAAFMHYCLIAPYSPSRLDEGVAWIAGNLERGVVMAVWALGFKPQRISTHAIEQKWTKYSKISDAVTYSKMENGHSLWVVNFPTAGHTWVYDRTEKEWHERGFDSAFGVQRTWFHCFVDIGNGPQHFLQDGINGNIYVESESYTTDNGTPIYWQRTCPYISDENRLIPFHRFQLDAAFPVTNAKLDWSDDQGTTYSKSYSPRPPRKMRSGYRYNWPKLGSGMRRIFRLKGTGPAALVNAYLRVSGGAG